MSKYYKARRERNLYVPGAKKAFRVSRSRIESFMKCPRCFYLDRRLGIEAPPGFPFTLNNAVDTLLKKEFDILRKNREPHALMKKYGIDAVPAQHPGLNDWRNNLKGISFFHEKTNLIIFGAIDDLWQNSEGEYIIVDYKATSKKDEITALDQGWQDSYKRQMEIYQWLARHNDLKVSGTGYFVYCNGRTDLDKFDGKLEFYISIIPYEGDDSWVENTVIEMHSCLNSATIPEPGEECDLCEYRKTVNEAL